ncbi:C40 family peptidase [Nocardia sp. alder85J]|uniref:C40 family peptidase n=1 Tax=Nocardia sp. alder85J TaxID=2862949 RepID=UPI001CD3548C|nr:NlpC/P60 family protein [Nocardia sp. alder85J]MCX4092186.1 NlpC/P60 family protein [Nocardia sp. alder85J]
MAPALADDLNGVLQSLLGLYGQTQPSSVDAVAMNAISGDLSAHSGHTINGYTDARGTQTTVADGHGHKDAVVAKAVAAAADTTVAGRSQLADQIADFRTRAQAITSLGDTPFTGAALLDAAQHTIGRAADQVGADVAAARKHAAQIMPPAASAPMRVHTVSATRPRRTRSKRRNLPSDATAGGSAVRAANAAVGTPYVWGGGGARGASGGGFDCSGLTQYAIAQASGGHVVLPRTTYEQIYSGVRVPTSDVRPGDLVFPASSFSARGPEHVQLAAGNGMVIEAPHSGATVRWSRMPSSAVVVRVL